MNLKPRTSLLLAAAALLLIACQISTNGLPSLIPGTQAGGGDALTFVSQENGISIRYPVGWRIEAPSAGDQSLVTLSNPDGSVLVNLFAFPAQEGDTPEGTLNELSPSTLQGLNEVAVLSDIEFTLPDGTPAWSRVVTATSDGGELKINLVTVIVDSRLFFLMAYGPRTAYEQSEGEVYTLLQGMTFSQPVIQGVSREGALFLEGDESTNPRDYDPATTHDSGDKRIFSGLVSFNTQLVLVPEVAESWELSTDGTVYTFHLRPNATFHDGRKVTAQDVIYSWERAADPQTESDTVLTYLGDIVGTAEMQAGTADHISGLRAVDEETLEVRIDAAKPYFLSKLTMPVAFILDRNNVESGPEWYRTPNGSGPYKLTRWDSFSLMVYEANPDFYLGEPAIPKIVIKLFAGVGIRLFESGEIDMAGVYSTDVGRLLDASDPLHPYLYSGVSLCTDYVVFDTSQPPFDDARVRQAFSMAFDRQKYLDVVYNSIGIPAKGPYPPALPGYDPELQGLPYDPEAARQLLQESKYGSAGGLPAIVYTDYGIGNTAGPAAAAMTQMWEQNLGVSITIENLEPDRFYDLLYSGVHGQLFSGGWCGDYPDAENFADVLFHTGAQQNLGNYSNPELDALLERARVEQDVNTRLGLYQQAERIIIEDAAALFTLHGLTYRLVNSNVQGYVLTPITIPIERYLWLR